MTALTDEGEPEDGNHCYAAVDDRPLLTRWLHRLFTSRRPEIPEDLEGYAPSYMVTETHSYLDWKDRLRVLLSGHIVTVTQTKTDVIVNKMTSVSTVHIDPPGTFPVREGAK